MATEALCIALAALAASIASFGLYVTLERRLRKTIRIVESLSADHAREIKLREDERVEVRVSASTVGASSLLEHSSGGPPPGELYPFIGFRLTNQGKRPVTIKALCAETIDGAWFRLTCRDLPATIDGEQSVIVALYAKAFQEYPGLSAFKFIDTADRIWPLPERDFLRLVAEVRGEIHRHRESRRREIARRPS
jgi:hypothetical protein